MPVQLPLAKRNPLANPTSIGRYNVQVDDKAGEILTKSVANLGKSVAEGVSSYQENVQKANEVKRKNTVNDLEVVYDNEIDKLRVNFDAIPLGENVEEKYKEVLKKRDELKGQFLSTQNLDNETRIELDRSLTKRDALFNERVYAKKAKADVAFTLKTKEAKLQLAKKDAILYAPNINPKDATSFEPFDEILNDIDVTGKDAAQAFGRVQLDSAGQPVFDETTNVAIGKQKSEVLSSAIQNLLAINQPDKAKALFDKYQPDIDNFVKPELVKQLDKAVFNQDVINQADKIIKNVPRNQQFDEVQKIKDPEKQRLVGDRVNNNRIKEDKKIKDIRDQQYSMAHDMIYNIQNSPNRYTSVDQMKSNPQIAQVWDKLDSKQKTALEGLIKRPDSSDYNQLDKIDQMLDNGELKDIKSRKEFDLLTNQLSNKDYNKYLNEWDNAVNPKAKGLSSGTRSYMLSQAKQQLQQSGILKKARGENGLDKKSLEKWAAFQDELLKDFDNLSGQDYGANTKSANDYVKDKVNAFVLKDKQNNKGFFDKIIDNFRGSQQNTPQEQPKQKSVKDLL